VVAQRLARSICQGCATKYYPTERELQDAGLADKTNRAFRKGGGCQQCHDSGFQGRFGIYEVMEVTSELRRMIHRATPSHELRQEFKRHGGRTLREEGVMKALEGMSSLEEVLRVTHSEDSGPLETEHVPGPRSPVPPPPRAAKRNEPPPAREVA
jgi:type II secretory ATPase GspE/PulE/Tfp pilus assembly ATPase PilB-like protein